ncbi:MAG: sigma-70 family RNA polymerase sigma factor [Actinocatenispora sp.]
MTDPAGEDFEAHRTHLTSVAYRMLGSIAEAEDAVQETWLRWQRADHGTIKEPRGWLTTVTGRICLDVLRSARVRREAYVGAWLPEPVVERLADPATLDPGDRVARADEVSFALLAMLERLSPEQRVAFVLHDVFDVPFSEIGDVLSVSDQTARQLASRARRAVRTDEPRRTAELPEQREVLAAFLRACQQGDLQGLLNVLAPDVVTIGDGGGIAPAAKRPIVGAAQVARFLLNIVQRAATDPTIVLEPVLVNGALGLLAHQPHGFHGEDVTAVLVFDYADGMITAVHNQLNPEKLTRIPDIDPSRSVWAHPGSAGQ